MSKNKLPIKVKKYLAEHGLIWKFLEQEYGVTCTENSIDLPVKDTEGNIIFTKSRNLNFTKEGGEPKYKNSSGSHAVLFNLNAVKDLPNIVLCEGEIDCLRLQQGGIPALSSTGGSNTFNKEWATYFDKKNVWICYDNDEAGKNGTRNVLEYLPHARVITLPEDTKDTCEFLRNKDEEDFKVLMGSALTKEEWETKHRPVEFSIISTQDLAKKEFEEHPWLIDKILYSEGFCFIYGAEGTGKSLLALSIAKAVAKGEDWLEHFHVSTPTNVLIIDKENPLLLLKKRVKGLGLMAPNIYCLEYPERFQLTDDKGEYSEFAQTLTSIINELKIGLVIFDSFVDFMVGNESSSGDTQAFFKAIRELYPNIAYLSLHHENKPAQGLYRSDSQRLRGSSNINAQIFTSFRLEIVAKSKEELTLKQTKARDSIKLNKFMVRMIIGNLDEENTVVTGFEYLGDVIEDESDTKIMEIQSLITEMLQDRPSVTRKEVFATGTGKGVSEKTIKRAIKVLVDSCAITSIRKGREISYVLHPDNLLPLSEE
ncbi:AAA family ATPase [candidate division WWE3 bacterium]|uniref:AAA family ATPase n=1 Tax=candidate division WWE3 bacterium TaxID=2053526 RepID=A0A7X9E685_UNCKA|nr:AAA family ATPase [candidate division WWE3 bacterium]